MELRLFSLALCMLLTGSINTIATKYQVPQLTLTHILPRRASPCFLPSDLPRLPADSSSSAAASCMQQDACQSTCVVQDETVVGYSKAGLALTFRHPAVRSCSRQNFNIPAKI